MGTMDLGSALFMLQRLKLQTKEFGELEQGTKRSDNTGPQIRLFHQLAMSKVNVEHSWNNEKGGISVPISQTVGMD